VPATVMPAATVLAVSTVIAAIVLSFLFMSCPFRFGQERASIRRLMQPPFESFPWLRRR
jgi:hypothetical protein